MNTKLFWENVNKRMKYERAQRLERRRKAGVKRDSSKSSQIENEKQLQIECLLQVLEEYVTASLSQPGENYDNDRLSEDIDIISIAVQKLKKDMMADVVLSSGMASETEEAYDTDRPGLSIVLNALDDLAVSILSKENRDPHLISEEQQFEEGKENSANLVRVHRKENLESKISDSGSDISSISKNNYSYDDSGTGARVASTKDSSDLTNEESMGYATSSVGSQQLFCKDINGISESALGVSEDAGKTNEGGFQYYKCGQSEIEIDSENTDLMEETVEAAQQDVANIAGAGNASGLNKVATIEGILDPDAVAPTNEPVLLETSEGRPSKDSFRILANAKFVMKQAGWSQKLTSRSRQENFSQLEDDMRKEKPKFNLKSDKVLQKAISSLKKNLRHQTVEEGPNPDPLPPKLFDVANVLDSAVKEQP